MHPPLNHRSTIRRPSTAQNLPLCSPLAHLAHPQRCFPIEHALHALHDASGDAEVALGALRSGSGTPSRGEEWSKVEERHFRTAQTRHRDALSLIHEAVRTKTLAQVVRFYYVEDGARMRAERDKQREVREQAESREHAPPPLHSPRARAQAHCALCARVPRLCDCAAV